MKYVVFGAGAAGQAVAAALVARGLDCAIVSASGRPGPEGCAAMAADLSKPEQAAEMARSAEVIFFCLGAAYHRWPELLPPLQNAAIHAASTNASRLVVLENLYGYGPTQGKILREDLPLTATGRKGRTRAMMAQQLMDAHSAGQIRMAIARASDFFGPGVTDSALGTFALGAIAKGQPATVMGNPDRLHSFTYIPNLGANIVALGLDARSEGRAWHLPNPAAMSTRQMIELAGMLIGKKAGVRVMHPALLRLLGLFNPAINELRETRYQFTDDWLVDATDYCRNFDAVITPIDEALADTMRWWMTQTQV